MFLQRPRTAAHFCLLKRLNMDRTFLALVRHRRDSLSRARELERARTSAA